MQNIGVWKCAQCVIFPGRHQPSIVTASELNYCVRNGNRCALATIITHLLSFIKESKQRKFQFCAYAQFPVHLLYAHRQQKNFNSTLRAVPCMPFAYRSATGKFHFYAYAQFLVYLLYTDQQQENSTALFLLQKYFHLPPG